MRRLFYILVVLAAVIVALALNLRAAHLFALFPDRTAALAEIVSGHSGLRDGRVRPVPDWSLHWTDGGFCGLDPCWSVRVTGKDGSDVSLRARVVPSGLRLWLEETAGQAQGQITLPSLGLVDGALRIDRGVLELELRTQRVLSGQASGRIDGLSLDGLALGTGPLTLSVPEPDRVIIEAALQGGPAAIDARIVLDLARSEGSVDIAFQGLGGFPADQQRNLRRVTTEEDGKRRLKLRFGI